MVHRYTTKHAALGGRSESDNDFELFREGKIAKYGTAGKYWSHHGCPGSVSIDEIDDLSWDDQRIIDQLVIEWRAE